MTAAELKAFANRLPRHLGAQVRAEASRLAAVADGETKVDRLLVALVLEALTAREAE